MEDKEIEGFKFPAIWQFQVDSDDEVIPTPAAYGDLDQPGHLRHSRLPALPHSPRKKSSKTICVLASTFDMAFATLRSKHPYVRVREVKRYDVPVHYVADDPRVAQAIVRMGA